MAPDDQAVLEGYLLTIERSNERQRLHARSNRCVRVLHTRTPVEALGASVGSARSRRRS